MGIVVCAIWALYCCVKVETFDLFSIEKEKEILGFVIYIVKVLVKMRDLLKVKPNGWLKSLISFIVIWLLRKFERTWECEKKNNKKKILGLMIYVLHFQDLCELRKRWIPLFDLVFLAFLCYFLFWEERDIKFEQKYLFTPDFNRDGLWKTNRTYHR